MATLWIIDGYNFIRQSRRFAEIEAREHAKGEMLAIEYLAKFSKVTEQGLVVVFDNYSSLNQVPKEEQIAGIKILRSRGGYTADEEIIELAEQYGEGCIVISSDRAILEASIRSKASILTSGEFERELSKIFDSIGVENDREAPRRQNKQGRAFTPPKEKKKAYNILKRFQ